MVNNRITIGEAAESTGLSTKAIRLYERRGLLRPAERTASGYRTYALEDLALLRFIRQAKAVGLQLDEIGQIIDLQRRGRQPCATVVDLLDRRLAAIDRTLTDLRSLRRTLVAAKNRARDAARSGQDAVICHIIEADAS